MKSLLLSVASIVILSLRVAQAANLPGVYFGSSGQTILSNPAALDWQDAETFAQTQGGHLASIHNDLQNQAVGLVGGGWIGFNNLGQGDVTTGYTWTDGSDNSYTHWNAGEPNNFNNAEHVAEYNGGNWNDNNQSNTQQSVYEVNGLQGGVHDPANGHTYYLMETTTWDAANSQAQAAGVNLVSITSQAENDFLVNTFGGFNLGNVWIGLHRDGNGNFTSWTDGSSLGFTNWNAGEPNNSGGVESVAEMIISPGNSGLNGKWNDNQPGLTHFAIVEQVPEPSACLLLAIGAAGLLMAARRRASNPGF